MSVTTGLSVVIPAHNEAALLPRLLRELGADADIRVVVSANACTDDTVAVARAATCDGVRVVETAVPSKAVALNAGDAVAGNRFPRVYVDADVSVSAATLAALADTLSAPGGPLVAAPTLRVDTSAASWAARAHYRIWELTDYRRAGHVGSGIYALSAEGRARFGAFPDVIADDRFVQQLFAPSERATIAEEFVVRSPATLRAHIRRATRIAAGNRQLRRPEGAAGSAAGAGAGPGAAPTPGPGFGRRNAGPSRPGTADPPIHLPKPSGGWAASDAGPAALTASGTAPRRHLRRKNRTPDHLHTADPTIHLPKPGGGSGYRRLLARVAPHPTLWPSFVVYCVGYGVPLALAILSESRGRLPGWNRDETSRT